jgi:hypothetical protein
MNDAFQQWLQQQGQSNPLQQWMSGQQQAAPQPQPTPQQQPNGKLLADMLRNKFSFGQADANAGGLEGLVGRFAPPLMGMLEQMNFSNRGRTPEGRADIRAMLGKGDRQ